MSASDIKSMVVIPFKKKLSLEAFSCSENVDKILLHMMNIMKALQYLPSSLDPPPLLPLSKSIIHNYASLWIQPDYFCWNREIWGELCY